MKKSIASGCVVALLMMSLVGCEKKNGDAIVIGKDYVAAVKQSEEIKDERAANHEQWIVKVRIRDNGRTNRSPRRSSAVGEFARKGSDQGYVSYRQIYRNRLRLRD
jgi:hypothetical protein